MSAEGNGFVGSTSSRQMLPLFQGSCKAVKAWGKNAIVVEEQMGETQETSVVQKWDMMRQVVGNVVGLFAPRSALFPLSGTFVAGRRLFVGCLYVLLVGHPRDS